MLFSTEIGERISLKGDLFRSLQTMNRKEEILNGAPRPMLREPLSLDIAYPIQWHESRVNLTELAKLRYIHGWSRQELARHYERTLNAITNYCQSIRRKNFDLDGLTVEEKEQIKWAYQN